TNNTTASTSADITQRALTVAAAGSNKVYDGNTTATVSLSDNRVAGDTLTASSTAANFADKNAGLAKAVSVTGISISGTDAANYTNNTTASTSADITRAPITNVTGITADNKVIDGTTAATLNTGGAGYAGIIAGDVLNVASATGNFDTPAVGSAKTVFISDIALGGVDAGNYTVVNNTATTTADIINVSAQIPLPPRSTFQAAGLAVRPNISASGLNVADANALLESAPTASGGCEAAVATGEKAASDCVSVTTVREATDQERGVVSVALAGAVTKGGMGFQFSLPAGLLALVAASDAPVQATTLVGKPLPAWLRYDPGSRSFVATAVPAGALPLQILVNVGSRSAVVTISAMPGDAQPQRRVIVDRSPANRSGKAG
ncbi:MAG TPA: YDG domain-containing protein, partial [Polaromonas sp.]|uniref:YDG domain-containing protein n=1 Tax=Polaromonas sp. TaxID=1869339 RepID=UPI002D46871B